MIYAHYTYVLPAGEYRYREFYDHGPEVTLTGPGEYGAFAHPGEALDFCRFDLGVEPVGINRWETYEPATFIPSHPAPSRFVRQVWPEEAHHA